MGQIHPPLPVKLIVPMLSARPDALERAEQAIAEHFGALDYVSADMAFDYTDYYTPELGLGIQRRFVAVHDLIDPGELAAVKVWSNGLEEGLSDGPRRPVNLDPGYICGGKLVLATTKNQSHRLYLGQGIYAEVTLSYRDKAFRVHPWTYPDYASPAYHRVFEEIRGLYMVQLRRYRQEARLALLDDQADV